MHSNHFSLLFASPQQIYRLKPAVVYFAFVRIGDLCSSWLFSCRKTLTNKFEEFKIGWKSNSIWGSIFPRLAGSQSADNNSILFLGRGSRMSHLTLYRPDVDEREVEDATIYSIANYFEEPAILPFDPSNAAVERAKILHMNQSCPTCDVATILPLELNDRNYDRRNRQVAGTGTIVAFHCNGCGHQWPAS